jgi:sensor histidine kinase YesM
MIGNSLRSRIVLYFTISLMVTVLALGFIMGFSMELQTMADRQFDDELQLQEIQKQLTEIQVPLLEFLSTRSSKSLSRLLILTQNLRSDLPSDRPRSTDQVKQIKREVFFLIEAYLEQIDQIIELKRGRNIEAYTIRYEEMQSLLSFINERIDYASLFGFRQGTVDYRAFIDLFRRMHVFNFFLMLLGAGFAFSLIMLTMDRITSPMYSLADLAGKLSQGDFSPADVHLNSVNEVNQVAEAFNEMKHSIHHYISELQNQKQMERDMMNARLRNMEMEQMLKRMELYTMQAQMNPHFLFNTLNTGVQLAYIEDAERTAGFMENLANLFRHNLKDQQFFIPLRHEIDGLRSYLDILRIRFPKTRRFELDVEDGLLDSCEVPAMVIQPLVENSVVHAFKNNPLKGIVSVRIFSQGSFLTISVKDNGSGIPGKTVERLLQPHTGEYSITSKVMGLENVIQRCYFFYPDTEDVITIVSAEDEGTEVLIRIDREVEPCIKS